MHDVTGLILAGGRGSRMGGVDKGLQNFRGMPLALQTLMRLQPQVDEVLVNANRNLAAYESLGVPVWPDALPDFAGPLAGFLTGLERCETTWLATVPCDTPLFPLDLVERLARAASDGDAEIAIGADGAEQVGRLEPVIPDRPRTTAAGRPAPGQCALLTDTGMGPLHPILEPDLDRCRVWPCGLDIPDHLGEVF